MTTRIAIVLFLLLSHQAFSQQRSNLVVHLQSSDTLVYKALVGQLANLKAGIPALKLEVVCHGPGIEFLMTKNSKYSSQAYDAGNKDVKFVACEHSMSVRHIKRAEIVPFAVTVPYGIVEIVKREQENWMYVKLGF